MKNIIHIVIIILFLTSCNEKELTKENQNLINKLEEKENIIRDQIKIIEEKKSEIKYLNQELKLLNEKLLENQPKRKLSELYKEVKSSVYLILAKNDENISQGSAFVVSKDGIAISNYHVFKNFSKAVAINEKGERFLISEILEENKDEDYIIFKVGPLTNSIPYLKISDNTPIVGEDVFTVGNPEGLVQTLSKGIISSFRDNGKLIQTSTEITHGSSGGPLFNKNGEVIGITSSGYGEANLNFAIDIQTLNIKKYLSSNRSLPTNNRLSRNFLISVMEKYYSALINEDFNTISNIFTNTLSRYYSLYSINKTRAIKDKKYYLSRFKIKSIRILPSTVEIYQDENEYTIQFQTDYRIIKRSSNRSLNYILNTVCIITKEGRIKSIYDNILKKTNSN